MPMFSKEGFFLNILANNNALLLNFLMWNSNQKLIFASMISQINMEKYKRKTDATTDGHILKTMPHKDFDPCVVLNNLHCI